MREQKRQVERYKQKIDTELERQAYREKKTDRVRGYRLRERDRVRRKADRQSENKKRQTE